MEDRKRKSSELDQRDEGNNENNNNNNNSASTSKEEELNFEEEDEFSIEALSKLPISEIKQQLAERNVGYEGIIEKPELVALLRKQIEQDIKEGKPSLFRIGSSQNPLTWITRAHLR